MIKSATIIDGKEISSRLLLDLKTRIDSDSVSAKLAIILVGDNAASHIYVQNKIKAAIRVGIRTELKKFTSDITEEKLLQEINDLNKDADTSGMIIQMPLPNHIDKLNVIKAIDPAKDVDGFHPINLGMLFSPYKNGFVPCTALGCLKLIKSCASDISGKKVVILGRSNIVGRPLAALLLKEDCTVTICHSKTKNLMEITSKADIVVSAMGNPKFLTKEYFNSSAIVIDVGINRVEQDGKYKLLGDVDFENVKNHVSYITPVPGGVGPMTVAYLLVNTYDAKVGLSF
ncbi:MAG: bifunctional 5,10-methylenetetrahydrofolate dehydrogenase/5,10-methenyltetrahydrofolate cyclohydrolase [Rickettsiaceae bacterium]|nr:bifunctional 5,10-methylenetetrahydrofolate dehydrogenase/5,10-methenyltetrahydrofolate cyclohydrolase [Rickettsiaceae bacterium]